VNGENKAILEKFVRVLAGRGPAGRKRLEEAFLRTDDSPDGEAIVFKPEDSRFFCGLAAECGVTPTELMDAWTEFCFEEAMKHIHSVPVKQIWDEFAEMMREREELLARGGVQ